MRTDHRTTVTPSPTTTPQVLAFVHAGAADQTNTAAAVTLEAARAGLTVLLIDLSEDGRASTWLGATPWERVQHVGSILTDKYPIGWARELAVPTRRHPELWVIPAANRPSRRTQRPNGESLRLALATVDDFDVVTIDCGRGLDDSLVAALNAATDLVVLDSEDAAAEVQRVTQALEQVRPGTSDEVQQAESPVRLHVLATIEDGVATSPAALAARVIDGLNEPSNPHDRSGAPARA